MCAWHAKLRRGTAMKTVVPSGAHSKVCMDVPSRIWLALSEQHTRRQLKRHQAVFDANQKNASCRLPGVLPLAARRVFCRKHIKPVWYYAVRLGVKNRLMPRELAASVLPVINVGNTINSTLDKCFTVWTGRAGVVSKTSYLIQWRAHNPSNIYIFLKLDVWSYTLSLNYLGDK
jgi:hypothetical protein